MSGSRSDLNKPDTCPPYLSRSYYTPDAHKHLAAAGVGDVLQGNARRGSLCHDSEEDCDEPPLPPPPQFSPEVAKYILDTSLPPSPVPSAPSEHSSSSSGYVSSQLSPRLSPQPSQQSSRSPSQSSPRLPGDEIPFLPLRLGKRRRRLFFRLRPLVMEGQHEHEQEQEQEDELAGPSYSLGYRGASSAVAGHEHEPRRHRVFTTYRAQRANHLRAVSARRSRAAAAAAAPRHGSG